MYTNIEAERARQRISKEKMAEILDISSKTYTNYINGITPIPSNIDGYIPNLNPHPQCRGWQQNCTKSLVLFYIL